ncbi:peptide-methionine (S)-S-oxide reductase MsrA [Propylenella binzhouense]|uniref:Peptide methionine sulfoxide reductase MsrA n=1 Tax=Propylenella binzhouense TaxID=2555902 RepID=A0A964T5K2_9HYPH|nr:peptide-methionine (S)-S-oxide reductase MsrA [Propylenella binzhouense]MYZ48804.1 peptide-methionine (S)-S-oxide reductase MsrA [Propylenella binzhouense]
MPRRALFSLAFVAALVLAPLTGFAAAPARTAIFAGGCFWCMEQAFDEVPGVISTTSGYSGGDVERPSYQQVSAGATGHFEAVKVEYDPSRVSYQQLLDAFWRNVDPFDSRGQFCDKGHQYLSVIFTADDAERNAAEASKKKVEQKFGRSVATRILPVKAFWPAEDYHQDFYLKNALKYKFYKYNCGRAQRLEELWGKAHAS